MVLAWLEGKGVASSPLEVFADRTPQQLIAGERSPARIAPKPAAGIGAGMGFV
jgi:hypothetical protein